MANRRCLCHKEAETIDHLFLLCDIPQILWYFLLHRFQRPWVMPPSVKMIIDVWSQESVGDLSGRGKLLWLSVPSIVSWIIWRERNARIF